MPNDESGTSDSRRVPPAVPWRTGLALGLAIIAQSTLEPPARAWPLALGMYGLALLIVFWAYRRQEFRLPDPQATSPSPTPSTYRRKPLIAALVLALAAFVLFSDNLFTWINVSLWLAALALFVRGVWQTSPERPAPWKRALDTLRAGQWRSLITPWLVLLLALAGLIIFFRVYQLDSVPGEPISDHAEKLLDVFDITQGQTRLFFPRNSGREFIQFYWTVAIAAVFGTGVSFLSLKIGTVLIGLLTLPYIYLLGREIGGKRVALFALVLAGTSYWLNVVSRIGLRFTLYPAFTAPALYYLIHGLRRQNRNDFILAGLFIGLGLNGYSAFRVVPIVAVVGAGIYVGHRSAIGQRRQTLEMFALLIVAACLASLPLLRYTIDNPDNVLQRTLTRMTGTEQPLSAPAGEILIGNTLNALSMFNYDDGHVWVHSVRHRPALDMVSAALLIIGYCLLVVRYLRRRHWLDLFLCLAVPLLLLPSILALAFPVENPALNRTGGAAVVVFVIAALALDGVYTALQTGRGIFGRGGLAVAVISVLLLQSSFQNYTLVFEAYPAEYRGRAWNATDLGRVIRTFIDAGNSPDNAFIVPYAHWVDTRLVGMQAGFITRDFAVWRDDLPKTQTVPGKKLFLVKDDDQATLDALQTIYPAGQVSQFISPIPDKNFWIFSTAEGQATSP